MKWIKPEERLPEKDVIIFANERLYFGKLEQMKDGRLMYFKEGASSTLFRPPYEIKWLDETESIPSQEEDELNKKATEWLNEWQKRRPGSAEYLTGCLEGYKEALKAILHHQTQRSMTTETERMKLLIAEANDYVFKHRSALPDTQSENVAEEAFKAGATFYEQTILPKILEEKDAEIAELQKKLEVAEFNKAWAINDATSKLH